MMLPTVKILSSVLESLLSVPKSLTQLDRYRWSGHGVLMGKIKKEKVSIKELRSGNRCKEVSGVRALIAIGLVKKHGVALAEVARRVGVSTAAVSKIIKRAGQ